MSGPSGTTPSASACSREASCTATPSQPCPLDTQTRRSTAVSAASISAVVLGLVLYACSTCHAAADCLSHPPFLAVPLLTPGAAGWLKSSLAAPAVAAKYKGVLNGIGKCAAQCCAVLPGQPAHGVLYTTRWQRWQQQQQHLQRRRGPLCLLAVQAGPAQAFLPSVFCAGPPPPPPPPPPPLLLQTHPFWDACHRCPPAAPLSQHLCCLHPSPSTADTSFWDPATDPLIPACFDAQRQEGKALCKRFLQEVRAAERAVHRQSERRSWGVLAWALPPDAQACILSGHLTSLSNASQGLGLTVDPSKPLVAVVSRLVPQVRVIDYASCTRSYAPPDHTVNSLCCLHFPGTKSARCGRGHAAPALRRQSKGCLTCMRRPRPLLPSPV